MINIIYGLRDPRNDLYYYIGKSTVSTKRAVSHLTNSHSKQVNDWVKSLNEIWLYPIVNIIEEVNDINNLPDREHYWINYYYGINPELLNIQLIDDSIQHEYSFLTDNDVEEMTFLQRIIFNIPEMLKKGRIARNLTQEEMAKKMNISRSTLSLIERGYNVNFKNVQQYVLTLKGIDILNRSLMERVIP